MIMRLVPMPCMQRLANFVLANPKFGAQSWKANIFSFCPGWHLSRCHPGHLSRWSVADRGIEQWFLFTILQPRPCLSTHGAPGISACCPPRLSSSPVHPHARLATSTGCVRLPASRSERAAEWCSMFDGSQLNATVLGPYKTRGRPAPCQWSEAGCARTGKIFMALCHSLCRRPLLGHSA